MNNNSINNRTISGEKMYTPMKISCLGNLSGLTQAMMQGAYSDGGLMANMMSMAML